MRRAVGIAYRGIGRVLPLDVTRVLSRRANAKAGTRASDGANRPELSCREIDAATLSERADADGLDIGPDLLEAVRAGGARCFVALDGGRIVGHDFLATGDVPARWNAGSDRFRGIALALPPGVAYLFKAWVAPGRRGLGVHGALLRHALADLDAGGVEGVVTTTDWTNAAALASFARVGFEPRGRALEARIGRRHLFGVPAPFDAAPGRRVTLEGASGASDASAGPDRR